MNHLDATTKNKILTDLFSSPQLNGMLKKFDAGGGNEDLKSELFEVLCFKDEKFIQDLHFKNQLIYYCTAIVQKFIYQTGGRFHRRYRQQCYDVQEYQLNQPDDSNLEIEEQIKKLDESIENDLHWVEKSIIHLYKKHGSVERVSRATKVGNSKISKNQVSRILNVSKQKIKNSLAGKLMGNYLVIQNEIILDVSNDVTPENINDILDDTINYLRMRLEGQQIPSKETQGAFVKSISPFKLKKVI